MGAKLPSTTVDVSDTSGGSGSGGADGGADGGGGGGGGGEAELTTVVASLRVLSSERHVCLMLTPRSVRAFPKLRPARALVAASEKLRAFGEGGFALGEGGTSDGETREGAPPDATAPISPSTMQFCWECGCQLERWGCTPRRCERDTQMAAQAAAQAAREAQEAAEQALADAEQTSYDAACHAARGRPDGLLLLVWKESVAGGAKAADKKRTPASAANDLLAAGRAHGLSVEAVLSFVFEAVSSSASASALALAAASTPASASASTPSPALLHHHTALHLAGA
jgi:hypothetical protein